MSSVTELFQEAARRFDAEQEKNGLEQKFEEIDRRSLAKMADKDLALWQSQYPLTSPQSILAQFEWNRRLTAEQVAASRWSAWFGIAGAIIGALAGTILTLIVQGSLK